MRRILVAAALLVACGWAIVAYCAEVNAGGPVVDDLICTSAETSVSMEFTSLTYAPASYTLWANDGAEFRFIRRFADGVRDTVGVLIPAGKSFNVPAPTAIYEGGVYTHTIFIGDHTDTVYAMPWYR